ncbi:MAG: hypothetical protein AN485_21100, partial [Anabaena sp. MDT14b]
ARPLRQAQSLPRRLCVRALKKQNRRRPFSCGCPHGVELEAQGCGTALERGDAAFALLGFVALLALVDEGLATSEHEVHHPRQLVGGGGVGAWFIHSTAQPSIERPQRRVAVRQAHGRHLQRLAYPVGRPLGSCREHLATADLRGRAQPQPRAEVLDVGEAAQVGADLAQNLHHRVQAQPVDAGEVRAGPVGELLANIELRARLATLARGLAQVHVGGRALGQQRLQLGLALGKVLGNVVVHRQRLPEHEQVLLAPVAGERAHDVLLAGLDAPMPVLGQDFRFTLAGHDVADDGLPGLAHHVADHLGELDVHLHQCLLHALHPAGLARQQHLALARHGADHAHVGVRPKRRAQQPVAHQLLQPLAVLHVALATGHVLDLPGVHQPDLQAALLEHLVHRDPVHAGRFQRHYIHAARQQPIGQAVQIVSHRADFAHRRVGAVRWRCRPVAGRSHVYRRRVGKNQVFSLSLAHCHAVLQRS